MTTFLPPTLHAVTGPYVYFVDIIFLESYPVLKPNYGALLPMTYRNCVNTEDKSSNFALDHQKGFMEVPYELSAWLKKKTRERSLSRRKEGVLLNEKRLS